MPAVNEHTGGRLVSRVTTKEYADNYAVIFGKKNGKTDKNVVPQPIPNTKDKDEK